MLLYGAYQFALDVRHYPLQACAVCGLLNRNQGSLGQLKVALFTVFPLTS
jgi:hypothetical protein